MYTVLYAPLKIASGIRRGDVLVGKRARGRRPGNFRTDAREATEFCECTRDERADQDSLHENETTIWAARIRHAVLIPLA
eukprot:COSAG02_NODE_52297_length_308_cov_1.483254_1_plen_79_part_10